MQCPPLPTTSFSSEEGEAGIFQSKYNISKGEAHPRKSSKLRRKKIDDRYGRTTAEWQMTTNPMPLIQKFGEHPAEIQKEKTQQSRKSHTGRQKNYNDYISGNYGE